MSWSGNIGVSKSVRVVLSFTELHFWPPAPTLLLESFFP